MSSELGFGDPTAGVKSGAAWGKSTSSNDRFSAPGSIYNTRSPGGTVGCSSSQKLHPAEIGQSGHGSFVRSATNSAGVSTFTGTTRFTTGSIYANKQANTTLRSQTTHGNLGSPSAALTERAEDRFAHVPGSIYAKKAIHVLDSGGDRSSSPST